MGKQYYMPDRSIKNAWIVFSTNRNNRIILSCKRCCTGVTTKGTEYLTIGKALMLFCYILLLFVVQPFVDSSALIELTRLVRIIISNLLAVICLIPMIPICIFFSFRFSKWLPVNQWDSSTIDP